MSDTSNILSGLSLLAKLSAGSAGAPVVAVVGAMVALSKFADSQIDQDRINRVKAMIALAETEDLSRLIYDVVFWWDHTHDSVIILAYRILKEHAPDVLDPSVNLAQQVYDFYNNTTSISCPNNAKSCPVGQVPFFGINIYNYYPYGYTGTTNPNKLTRQDANLMYNDLMHVGPEIATAFATAINGYSASVGKTLHNDTGPKPVEVKNTTTQNSGTIKNLNAGTGRNRSPLGAPSVSGGSMATEIHLGGYAIADTGLSARIRNYYQGHKKGVMGFFFAIILLLIVVYFYKKEK